MKDLATSGFFKSRILRNNNLFKKWKSMLNWNRSKSLTHGKRNSKKLMILNPEKYSYYLKNINFKRLASVVLLEYQKY